jgi:hypothetical protein
LDGRFVLCTVIAGVVFLRCAAAGVTAHPVETGSGESRDGPAIRTCRIDKPADGGNHSRQIG